MPVANSYHITLAIEKYLELGGSEQTLLDTLGFKSTKRLRELIEGQLWEKKHVKKLMKSKIIALQQRKLPRGKIHDAEEITRQVVEWMEDWGHLPKFCLRMGFRSPKTYNNRVTLHNWTKQELSILINNRIVDDSFTA